MLIDNNYRRKVFVLDNFYQFMYLNYNHFIYIIFDNHYRWVRTPCLNSILFLIKNEKEVAAFKLKKVK